MTLVPRIQRSEVLINWIGDRLGGTALPANLRFRLAAGCLDAALEHYRAIVLLIAHSFHGSAFALVRSMFEAYVRGAWLHQCASEDQLQLFKRGTLGHSFGSFLSDLEKLDAFREGVLSSVKKKSWDVMCGFTHTGFDQVVRRNTENDIGPNYEVDELIEALDFADGIAIMAGVEFAHLASDDYLAMAFLEKAKGLAAPVSINAPDATTI